MKLSVLIPVRDEEGCIAGTISRITERLSAQGMPYEIIVVNDGSTDATEEILKGLSESVAEVRYVNNDGLFGFGLAIRKALDIYTGDAAVIAMGDGSDSPDDIVRYYEKLQEGYECVFGSRFIQGGRVEGYPSHKMVLNRIANFFVKALFRIPLNDTTNSFKGYKRHVIDGLRPLLSHHFNLTVELPLKSIVRGYKYAIIPISWVNRKSGMSKLRIKEMGSRYLFIVLYLFFEKILTRGDYYRRDIET